MSAQGDSTNASSGKGDAPRPTRKAITASIEPSSPSKDPLLQRKYQELIRKHLDRFLDALFAKFTGVHFHAAWTPPPPRKWDGRSLPTGCSVCCRLSGSPLLPDCGTCGAKQLAHTLRADGDGHRFTCRLGVRNYWVPIRLRGETLGLAYLQALAHSPADSPARKRSASLAQSRIPRDRAKVLNRVTFSRAAQFLRFIVQHVQTSSLADLRKADLTSAGRAMLALEKEQARLHETLKQHLPRSAQAPRRPGPESHAEQIVHNLLERLELDYRKPITLQHYVRELRMNAAYVSSLFSRAVGVPFKIYLTELRMEKARELLGEAANSVSDVAYAVGYSSGDRFRFAFKKATGLSPRLWRQTMQANPPPSE
jgi:AraC-like DNA-binding protein